MHPLGDVPAHGPEWRLADALASCLTMRCCCRTMNPLALAHCSNHLATPWMPFVSTMQCCARSGIRWRWRTTPTTRRGGCRPT